MEEYLKLLDECNRDIQESIRFDRGKGWQITIRSNSGVLICDVKDVEMQPCFEKAYAAVKKWAEAYYG